MRALALAALVIAALAASALLTTRYADTVSAPPGASAPRAAPDPDRAPREPRPRPHAARATPTVAPVRVFGRDQRPGRAELGPRIAGASLLTLIVLELAGGFAGLVIAAAALAVRRTRARSRRVYARYALHLSPHDEAKPQDLEDMLEAIANLVRALPAERARYGQPFAAFELLHDHGPSGALEWSIAIRCEPALAVALDGTLSAAYPDIRLGHTRGEDPQPLPADPRIPGHVMRFRKQRSFIYPLLAAGDELASPPLEAIAHTQVSLAVPSVIRFALTPAPVCFEALARRLYRRRENRLVRAERWGLPEGGLTSTLNRSEMANAERTQNRSLFWLEASVAAAERETCRRLAAAVQARRGENRLHRRWMPVRHDLYRRRFPTATPPLIPSPRALISAAEAAHLLALPTARMKGVPVRRVAIPRIPMPPEIHRADAHAPVPTPTPARESVAPEAQPVT